MIDPAGKSAAPASAPALFEVEGVRVTLPDLTRKPAFGPAPRLTILDGISFRIDRGEVIGIVGGSGSGKSTLGRMLLRLLEPAAGRLVFAGQDITHASEATLRPLRPRMQMIFQDPMSALNPRQTVGTIIAAPTRDRDRIAPALAAVGLDPTLARRYPHELSGGQRQRVGIARAVALRPDFILADEIVSGLDASSQAQVLHLLAGLIGPLGLTLGFISHDLAVIRRIATRVMVIAEGRIVEDRPVADLFASPAHPVARALIAASGVIAPVRGPPRPGLGRSPAVGQSE